MKSLIFFIVVMLCLTSPLHAKKVYKYVDEHGKTIYSDEPFENAQEITLPAIQTYTSIPLEQNNVTTPDKPAMIPYKIVITYPEHDFVVAKDIESIEVRIFVEPPLDPHHALQLYINDEPYLTPQRDPIFTLHELVRGTFQIKAVVADIKHGRKIITESSPIDIHVQRTKVNTPK